MEYKALYRKYRPVTFEDVFGQDAVTKVLKRIISEKKINHAYLFNGPRGTGKTSVAKLFAKAINCLNPDDGSPCGKCEICKYFDNESITDIIEIDAASNNGVDEIRELKNKVNLVPTKCKYKVYIIDEVHMLSMGAFNALLKTLEEPPMHIVFILATTEIHKVPLTILSRCQNFNFKKISAEKMQERLLQISKKENITIEMQAIDEIAQSSDGGMRDAIGLLEQLNAYADDIIKVEDVHNINGAIQVKQVCELLTSVFKNNVDQMLECVSTYYDQGKDFGKIGEQLILVLKNLLLLKKAPKFIEKKIGQDIRYYEMLIKLIDIDKIYKYINEVTLTLTNMQVSSYPKILFEIMLLKMINNDQLANDEQQDSKLENTNTDLGEIKVEEKKANEERDFKNDKRVLVNNTLALATKDYLNEYNANSEQLNTYLLRNDLKKAASILLDAKPVAASLDHLIFTYKYDAPIEKFDNAYLEIEKVIKEMMKRVYIAVALSDEEWANIRPKYVNMTKNKQKIELIDEVEILQSVRKQPIKKKAVSKDLEGALDEFGNELIEMEG